MLIFNSAGGALQGAARHFDILCLPGDLWVMIAQPVVSQDQALLSKTGDSQLSVL
jgi:hypothetical protein